MNDTNRKNLIKKMKETAERCKTDKEFARKVLLATGIYTPTGRLKKMYK